MRKGFTLLELMIVVAIIGILTSIASFQIQTLIALGRVNGGATTVARLFTNARVRALAMHCPVMVQINGPQYVPSAPVPGFPNLQNEAYVFMKGDCTSTNAFFESDGAGPLPDDRVIAEFPVDSHLKLMFPTNIIGASQLTNQAVLVGWTSAAAAPKVVAVDTGGGFNLTPTPLIDISFNATDTTMVRHTFVPDLGLPYCD